MSRELPGAGVEHQTAFEQEAKARDAFPRALLMSAYVTYPRNALPGPHIVAPAPDAIDVLAWDRHQRG
jgi:hypothetical protein